MSPSKLLFALVLGFAAGGKPKQRHQFTPNLSIKLMLFQIKYPTGCEKTDKMTHRIRDLVLVFSVASRPPDKYRRERDLLGSFAGDPAGVG